MSKTKTVTPNREPLSKVLARSEERAAQSIREQAVDHVPAAIETLGRYAKGKSAGRGSPLPPPSVIRQAARDVLEIAGGRPETRDPRVGDPGQQVQIFIQEFGTDRPPRAIQVIGGRSSVLADAEKAVEGVHAVYEIPEGGE